MVKSKHEKTSLAEKYNRINCFFLNPCDWITDLERLKIIIFGSCICFLVYKPLHLVLFQFLYMSVPPAWRGAGTPACM